MPPSRFLVKPKGRTSYLRGHLKTPILGLLPPPLTEEHQVGRRQLGKVYGSSPHGRGTHIPHPLGGSMYRVIPARAGNTWARISPRRLTTGHPRTGGEHSWLTPILSANSGSSPHGRGTPPYGEILEAALRVIPARAGNTWPSGRSRSTATGHPRTGGEHEVSGTPIDMDAGSSPHGRGTQRHQRSKRACTRVIPARAGNTNWTPRASLRPSGHPRTGGEHTHTTCAPCFSSGSSPHGRGTLDGALRSLLCLRVIPARAGNTHIGAASRAPPTGHPRTGGEHAIRVEPGAAIVGSSPHGRGTRE